jgi:hypothetical protein
VAVDFTEAIALTGTPLYLLAVSETPATASRGGLGAAAHPSAAWVIRSPGTW